MSVKKIKDDSILSTHPCFNRAAHHKYGRVHMPIAPKCNIQCRYCVREYDCANESRPGVTSRVLSPSEALDRVRAVTGRDERITVVGVAGPGDPLANPETFEFLHAVHREYPHLTLCLSTNGLLLPDKLSELMDAGLDTLTVTINATAPEVAASVYRWVRYNGRTYEGLEAGELLLDKQWNGLKLAVEGGLAVKVNTITIPGINEHEIPRVAQKAGALGATIMNITALIPQAEFADINKPSREDIAGLRLVCGEHIALLTHCRQCRADATGLLGEDKDMEMEAFLAVIGEEYTDAVM